jgi:biopolymer transport protein ExbD
MAFGRKRERNKGDAAQLEMTPMIDVVFQLLIFFIVTLKTEDIYAHLDVSRPAPDPDATPEEKVEDLLEIMVYNKRKLGGHGVSFQKKKVPIQELERQLMRLARFSQDVSIIIKCAGDSAHGTLVEVLNICSKAGLTNLNVFSIGDTAD